MNGAGFSAELCVARGFQPSDQGCVMTTRDVDRQVLAVWFWLSIVGIILMLVGWFRAAF